jgi:hypothetical protein
MRVETGLTASELEQIAPTPKELTASELKPLAQPPKELTANEKRKRAMSKSRRRKEDNEESDEKRFRTDARLVYV